MMPPTPANRDEQLRKAAEEKAAERREELTPDEAEKKYAPVKRSDFDMFMEYVKQRASVEGPMAMEKLTRDQTQAIITATTEEELEAAMEFAGVTGLRDVPNGTVIQFNGFHYVPGTRSEFKNRFETFAVMDCTVLTATKRFGEIGTSVMLDTGVERIIAWLRAVESGQIPGLGFPVKRIVIKQPTGEGKELITLKKLPPVLSGETVTA
jgi:hypothetical protein